MSFIYCTTVCDELLTLQEAQLLLLKNDLVSVSRTVSLKSQGHKSAKFMSFKFLPNPVTLALISLAAWLDVGCSFNQIKRNQIKIYWPNPKIFNLLSYMMKKNSKTSVQRGWKITEPTWPYSNIKPPGSFNVLMWSTGISRGSLTGVQLRCKLWCPVCSDTCWWWSQLNFSHADNIKTTWCY